MPTEVRKSQGAEARLQESRRLYKKEILAERTRGLCWLAAVTFAAVWLTGVFNKDAPLQP